MTPMIGVAGCPLAKMFERNRRRRIAGDDDGLDAACDKLVAQLFGKGAHLGIAASPVWVTGAVADVDGRIQLGGVPELPARR